MSDTPQTDALESARDSMDTRAHADYVAALGLCHILERQRNEARLEIANLKRAIQDVRDAKGRFNTQTACEKMFKMID